MQTQTVPDTAMADRFLESLGFGQRDPLILSLGNDDGYWRVPRLTRGDMLWTQVADSCAKGRDWAAVIKLLDSRPNACFQSCTGGTKADEIDGGWLLVYEIDNYPVEEQDGLWRKAGLPDPTAVVFSGHGSNHCWYRLDQHYEPEDIEHGRKRLAKAVNDVLPDGVECDQSVAKVTQPMRLPGFIHPKSGEMATVSLMTGNVYTLQEILECCPELDEGEIDTSPKGEADETNLFNFKEDDEPAEKGSYPKPADLKGRKIPLTVGLSAKTKDVIATGKPRAGKHRFEEAYRISQSVQAAKRAIEFLGYEVDGDAWSLFQDFCRNSRCERGFLGKYSNIHACAANFETKVQNFGPAELTENSIKRAIAKWAKTQGYWQPGKEVSSHVADRSLPRRLDFLKRYITRVVREHPNQFRRDAYVRHVWQRLHLNKGGVVKEAKLTALMLEVAEEAIGETFNPLTAQDRADMPIPTVEWLVENVIPKSDLSLIVGVAKTGKSILASDLCVSLLNGTPFLDNYPVPAPSKVLLCTDDEGAGDTAGRLVARGIYDHPNLLWSQHFRVTEHQQDKLLDQIKANPGLVVILDSLRSICRSLDCTENDVQMGLTLYTLKQAVSKAGGTLIMIHHSSKDPNVVGSAAVSGHGSIAAAANTVISIHYPTNAEGKINKEDPARRLFREARSGPPFDLLLTLGEDVRYRLVGKFQECSPDDDAYKAMKDAIRKKDDLTKDTLDRLLYVDGPTTVFTLLKAVGRCSPAGAVLQRELDNPSLADLRKITRGLNSMAELGVVESKSAATGSSGGNTRELAWQLTTYGALAVREALD